MVSPINVFTGKSLHKTWCQQYSLQLKIVRRIKDDHFLGVSNLGLNSNFPQTLFQVSAQCSKRIQYYKNYFNSHFPQFLHLPRYILEVFSFFEVHSYILRNGRINNMIFASFLIYLNNVGYPFFHEMIRLDREISYPVTVVFYHCFWRMFFIILKYFFTCFCFIIT